MRSLSKLCTATFIALGLLFAHSANSQQVAFSDVTALTNRLPDQVIHYGEHDAQFIEFWHAQGTQAPAPTIILVHGGCWLNAFGVDHTRGAATALADQGFAVWSLEYRRLGDEGGGWPNSRDDIITAINTLHRLSPPTVDLGKVIVAGHSAGGHLALHAVEHTKLRPLLTVGLAAITNMATFTSGDGSCQRAGADFLATASDAQPDTLSVRPDSELSRILFYGQTDSIVGPAQAKLAETQAVMIENAGHFDFIHPDTAAWNVWLQHIKYTLSR